MAIRIRSRFHVAVRKRSPRERASVVAALAWKLAQESIGRMREGGFDIDLGAPYFDFVCESLAFHAGVADRIAYRKLDAERRREFTAALVERLAQLVEDNAAMQLHEVAAGQCRRHFVDLYNGAGAQYAQFDYAQDGPDFGYRRCFATRASAALPPKDQAWVYDQVMEIEAPRAVEVLEKALRGLFADFASASPH